jgi:Protein of unknown function (DUF4065)
MGTTNKLTRLMEASMALLQGAPDGQLKIVALNKGLFYLDLIALRDLGRTITEERYVALPQGPVVAEYHSKIVRSLSSAGLATQLEIGKAKPLRVTSPLSEFTCLAPSDVELANSISRLFAPRTSTLLSNFSHDNPGWILAYKDFVAGRPAPEINMRIAMQQVAWEDDDDDDRWMSSQPDEKLLQRINEVHRATSSWE